jgi:hypothetical protein
VTGKSFRITLLVLALASFAVLKVTYQPRCLHDGRDELCYQGPSYWMARATLKRIVAHQPAFDVRARLSLSALDDRTGVATLFLATPAGLKPLDLAPLGRALYAAQGLGVDDIFVTDADGGNARFLHNACSSGGTDSSCCVGVIPSAAPAVPHVKARLAAPAGGAIADGTYLLSSMRADAPPERFSRVMLAIHGSALLSMAEWDTDWTRELDCPAQCEGYIFRVNGSHLLANKTCPACTGKDCEADFGFTANDGGLTLFTGEGNEPHAEMTFARQ